MRPWAAVLLSAPQIATTRCFQCIGLAQLFPQIRSRIGFGLLDPSFQMFPDVSRYKMWVIVGIRFEDINAVFQACERMCPSRLNDGPIVSKNLTLCTQWMPDKQMARFSGFLTFSLFKGVPGRRFATSRTKSHYSRSEIESIVSSFLTYSADSNPTQSGMPFLAAGTMHGRSSVTSLPGMEEALGMAGRKLATLGRSSSYFIS